jgi:subfamily B ATP-binding cassette protein HlyB/CyaB
MFPMKLFRFRKPAFRQRSPGHLAGTDMLWLLGSLCQLHRIPFDPLLIERQFPPPCSIATIHNALDALGFKTGESALPFDAVGLSKS